MTSAGEKTCTLVAFFRYGPAEDGTSGQGVGGPGPVEPSHTFGEAEVNLVVTFGRMVSQLRSSCVLSPSETGVDKAD